MKTNPTTELINQIRERDQKLFGLRILSERSETLEWVILSTANRQQIAIHWDGKEFRTNTVEGYTGTGFISSLFSPETPEECRKIIRFYFRNGYEALFKKMLQDRLRTAPEKWLTMEEVKKSLQKSRANHKRRKTKPSFLEIPPSLKEIVAEKEPFKIPKKR